MLLKAREPESLGRKAVDRIAHQLQYLCTHAMYRQRFFFSLYYIVFCIAILAFLVSSDTALLEMFTITSDQQESELKYIGPAVSLVIAPINTSEASRRYLYQPERFRSRECDKSGRKELDVWERFAIVVGQEKEAFRRTLVDDSSIIRVSLRWIGMTFLLANRFQLLNAYPSLRRLSLMN